MLARKQASMLPGRVSAMGMAPSHTTTMSSASWPPDPAGVTALTNTTCGVLQARGGPSHTTSQARESLLRVARACV